MKNSKRFLRSSITGPLFVAMMLLAIFALAGCSAVFDAGLSGTIIDADSGSGIAGVMVYAYTDEGLRDSDYADGKGASIGADGVKLFFTPSTAGNYIPSTATGDNGSFTINKLIWKTLSPAFGKTADYLDVYLLYFHSDYGLVREESRVTIVSDSNNSSRVKAELASRLKSKRITINIKDIATDKLATTGFEVKVKATIAGKSEPYYSPDAENLNNVTGTTAITVPYLADKLKGESTVRITVSIPDESTWRWVDTSTEPDYYMASDDYSITVTDDELRGEAAISKTAYVKNYEFDYPAFSGTVATEGVSASGLANASNDNMHVWLAEIKEKDSSGAITLKVIDSVITGPDGNGANTSTIYHGLFTGLGAGKRWEPALEASGEHQGDYSGAKAKTVAYLIIDDSAAGIIGTPDIADYFYLVNIKCTDEAQKPLGVLSVPKNSAFKASGSGDYFITAVENDI